MSLFTSAGLAALVGLLGFVALRKHHGQRLGKFGPLVLLGLSLTLFLLAVTGFYKELSGDSHMTHGALMLHVPSGGALVFLAMVSIWGLNRIGRIKGLAEKAPKALISDGLKAGFFLTTIAAGGSILIAMTKLAGTEMQGNLLRVHVVSSWGVIVSLVLLSAIHVRSLNSKTYTEVSK